MHAWEAIQKTLDIIEQRINDDIQIEELADAAALSLFYYQRLFSRLVRKPVREYIKLRRLARACESLRNKDKRIIDVAFDCGFSSHELFSKAFKEAYGITPTEYKKSDVRLNNFDKPDLLLGYTMIDMGVPLINDGLVLELNRQTLDKPVHFTGVRRYVPISGHFPNGEATGVAEPGEIWRLFGEIEGDIAGKPSGRKIGVAYGGDAPEGSFSYFVGAETEEASENASIQTWTLPAADYLICRFEAATFEELVSVALNKAFNYKHMWEKSKGLIPAGFGAEIYYSDMDAEQDFVYMEIWSMWLEEKI